MSGGVDPQASSGGVSIGPRATQTDAKPAAMERPESGPAEVSEVHTHILRCMLAADDSYAYWRHVDADVALAERPRVAFERRWFGTKSESRVRTLIANLTERFDAYPETLALLHRLANVPALLRPFICHVHLQLADPIYRRFTGELLPQRRDHGYAHIDRDSVAHWIQSLHPGRWASATQLKFASNLIATALDVGLVRGRRDPRQLAVPAVPPAIVGYILYLLRGIRIKGSLLDNPYLRSLDITPRNFPVLVGRVPGIRFAELGGVGDLTWLKPDLTAWGLEHLTTSDEVLG